MSIMTIKKGVDMKITPNYMDYNKNVEIWNAQVW